MYRQILISCSAILITTFTQVWALEADTKNDEEWRNKRPAQNIERDERAKDEARWRDRRGNFRRLFRRGREVRTMDGSGNNTAAPLAGASFQHFGRLTKNYYADGISKLAGPLRKSAREISNIVVDQNTQSFPNEFGTSDFLWQWGQFIDHDLTLGDGIEDPNAPSSHIAVPRGDRHFDPRGEGDKVIHFNRAIFDPETGTDLYNPRAQINEISAWIDGSMVYGSSDERASALRTNDGTGRLKTSRGKLLPFNTSGLPNANGPAPDPTKLFIAGDVRVNEQVGLAVMHTLFVREHNRWAEVIKWTRPHYSGDDIYESARRLVIAQIQIITYEEFLPALIGSKAMPRYRGYQPGDPAMSVEFAGAAFRFGHSAINTELLRLNRRGKETKKGHLPLRSAFFNAPDVLQKRNDLDPILRGLAAQRSQRIDAVIVDDLRNFLFGPPGAGGFDLASLNIQRGRDLGLPSYNDMRETMGFERADGFEDITADINLQQALFKAYGDVNDIDLWVGGLAEDPLAEEGSQLGPLFQKILALQFAGLRDHDRFWYKRDLTRAERKLVKNTTLSKIIRANTKIKKREIPKNVFYVRD